MKYPLVSELLPEIHQVIKKKRVIQRTKQKSNRPGKEKIVGENQMLERYSFMKI